MADRDLRRVLEPLGGDDPSPEVVDRIWRRLDAELTGGAPSIAGEDGEFQMVKVEDRDVERDTSGRRRWIAGAAAAAVLLAVVGFLVVVRYGAGEDGVRVGDDPVPTTEPAPPTTAAPPPTTASPAAPEVGAMEQLLTIYFEEGIAAAATSGLAAPDAVYGPGGAADPGATWFTELEGYFTVPELDLECVEGRMEEVCLVEADVPLSRIVDRRGRVLLRGVIDADGRIEEIEPWGNSEVRFIGAYEAWAIENHPEIAESCDEKFVACFPDDLLDEFAASDDFVDAGPTEVTLP